MRVLPHGTVTFLFTDIDGSTRLWDRHPGQMRVALARHDALMREAIERHEGHVFKTVGDAFCAAFVRPADALDAARAAQRALLGEAWPAPVVIKARMALHAGNADVRDGDYFGPPLNRIARLLAAGHGGQVLVSRAAAEILGDALPEGLSLRDMGEQRLRDLSRPEHVYQLVDPALPSKFAPLRLRDDAAPDPGRPRLDRTEGPAAGTVTRTNVATPVEALLGRDRDIDAIRALLASHRLVTILGSGGIGKTRVALDVARAEADSHPNGAWWVDLAAVTAGDRVAAAIAGAVGLNLGEGDPAAKLAAALRHLDMAIVLDNCEHIVADVARIVQAVLGGAPRMRVLATSQVALKVPGEQTYRLATLDTPTAVALLEKRAHALDRRFALDGSNVAAAAAICTALEGVPLAIEMAAARVPLMGLAAVRDRLDDRFRMLASSNRLAHGRHQTLVAVLDWSHALLSHDEKVVFRRIGAFAGGFGMEAARSIAHDDALDEWAVLDALGGLVDKSLLQVAGFDPPRYRLLETTRLYALARLDEAGESARIRARHAAAMSDVADRIMEDSFVMTDARWNEVHEGEYQDVIAAFEHASAERNPCVAGHTAVALRMMDVRRGTVSGLRARMEACFDLLPGAAGLDAAILWSVVTPSDQIAIDAIPRLESARRRVAAWRAQDDVRGLYAALCTFADELARAGDTAQATRTLDEAAALEEPDWPPRLRMMIPQQRGAIAMYAKDAEGYRRHRREVLRLAEQSGATRIANAARLGLGDAALLAQDYEEAATLSAEVADTLRFMNVPFSRAIALENLANALVHLGDLPGALRAAAESLPTMRVNEAGADVFNILALVAMRSAMPEMAARMLGHVDAWIARSQYHLAPNEARAAEEAGREIDAAIGEEAHARLRAEGATLTDEDADALADTLFNREARRDP